MADDSPPEQPPSPQESSSEASPGPAPPQTTVPSPAIGTDRTELLHRARTFLTSPQVQHEDVASKRRFLVEKGLTGAEIEGLLYEVVRPAVFLHTSVLTYHLASTSTFSPGQDIPSASTLQSAPPTSECVPGVYLGGWRLRSFAIGLLRTSSGTIHNGISLSPPSTAFPLP